MPNQSNTDNYSYQNTFEPTTRSQSRSHRHSTDAESPTRQHAHAEPTSVNPTDSVILSINGEPNRYSASDGVALVQEREALGIFSRDGGVGNGGTDEVAHCAAHASLRGGSFEAYDGLPCDSDADCEDFDVVFGFGDGDSDYDTAWIGHVDFANRREVARYMRRADYAIDRLERHAYWKTDACVDFSPYLEILHVQLADARAMRLRLDSTFFSAAERLVVLIEAMLDVLALRRMANLAQAG